MTVLHNDDLPEGIDFGDSVAIDTEMTGLNLNRDRLCLVQLSDVEGNCHIVKFDGKKFEAPNLKALLEDEKVQKIFHYARSDVGFIYKDLGVMTKNIYCTKIASKLCRTYTEKHGLKDLVLEVTGTELEKENQCSDWAAENITDDQLKYAANDVLFLHKVKAGVEEKLERTGRKELAQACFDFLPTRVMLDVAGFEDLDIFAHH